MHVLTTLLALRRLGLLSPEDVPELATRALSQGFDSPSLRVLAGAGKPTWRDIAEDVDRLAREFDLPELSPAEAVDVVVEMICRETVSGEREPKAACSLLASICQDAGYPERLLVFYAIRDEFDDRPGQPWTSGFDAEVLNEARAFLSDLGEADA